MLCIQMLGVLLTCAVTEGAGAVYTDAGRVLLTCAVTEGTGAVYSDVMFAVDVCCICY